jgi:hypothetical protein
MIERIDQLSQNLRVAERLVALDKNWPAVALIRRTLARDGVPLTYSRRSIDSTNLELPMLLRVQAE